MKTKEAIEALANEYANELGVTVPENLYRKGILAGFKAGFKQSQQDNKPVDVEKLRKEFMLYSLKLRKLTADDIFSFFEPNLSNKSEDKESWVSVEERLPENTEKVQIYLNREISVGWYSRKNNIWIENNYGLSDCSPAEKVTHWRPLPQPPKQD